ncbi:hypothetical protein BC829DRAFT_400265 [Chytridium lagenaria]|nr:hypothetical protein BC829DRAFT_400265 [Chytridium lagenaria]
MRNCIVLSTWEKLTEKVNTYAQEAERFLRGTFREDGLPKVANKHIRRYMVLGLYPQPKAPAKPNPRKDQQAAHLHGYSIGGVTLIQWNVTDGAIGYCYSDNLGLNSFTQSSMVPNLILLPLERVDAELKANASLIEPKHVWCPFMKRENKGARSSKSSIRRLDLKGVDEYVAKNCLDAATTANVFDDFNSCQKSLDDHDFYAIEYRRCFPLVL